MALGFSIRSSPNHIRVGGHWRYDAVFGRHLDALLRNGKVGDGEGKEVALSTQILATGLDAPEVCS